MSELWIDLSCVLVGVWATSEAVRSWTGPSRSRDIPRPIRVLLDINFVGWQLLVIGMVMMLIIHIVFPESIHASLVTFSRIGALSNGIGAALGAIIVRRLGAQRW